VIDLELRVRDIQLAKKPTDIIRQPDLTQVFGGVVVHARNSLSVAMRRDPVFFLTAKRGARQLS
jgi:hypothetical protein